MFLKDSNSSNGNGYHHHQPPSQPPSGMVQTHRARRGTRRSRASVSSSSSTVRVSDTEQPPQQQQQLPNRSPCTDYDMAYFHSYAHLGIHQEMIKVFNSTIFLFQFCFFLHLIVSELYVTHCFWNLNFINPNLPYSASTDIYTVLIIIWENDVIHCNHMCRSSYTCQTLDMRSSIRNVGATKLYRASFYFSFYTNCRIEYLMEMRERFDN